MMYHARSAWWLWPKSVRSEKAPRTGEYASNPERKNTPCISDLAGVKFLLKKERVFFFRGSALQVFGQCVGLQCGLDKAKTIFAGEKDFALPRLFLFWSGSVSAAQESQRSRRSQAKLLTILGRSRNSTRR
ncbi:MAG: hypothetical protein AAB411_02095 [Patescibacteria group bacterium]